MARNSILQAFAFGVGKFGTLVLYAVMARSAGLDAFGDFTTAASLSVLVMVAAFGVDYRITRLVARDEDGLAEAFWSAIAIKLVLGTALLAVFVGIAVVGPYSARVVICTALLGGAMLAELAMLTPHAVFRGMEELRPVAIALSAYRSVVAIAGVALLLADAGIETVAAAWMLSAIGGLAYSARQLRLLVMRFPVRISRGSLRDVGLDSLALGISGVFGAALARLDIVLLGLYRDNEAVAYYGGAYRFIESTDFLTAALAISLFPAMARLSRTSSPSLAEAISLSLKAALILIAPVVVFFVVYADPLLAGVYGGDFRSAGEVLQLLALVMVPSAACNLVTYLLSAQERQRPILTALALGSVVNIGANVVLIPQFGAKGAAAAWVITSVAVCSMLLPPTLRVTGRLAGRRILAGPVLASAAMAAVGFATGATLLGALPAFLAFGLVLGLVEWRLHPADLRWVLGVLRRRG